jgi:hypothetical protein
MPVLRYRPEVLFFSDTDPEPESSASFPAFRLTHHKNPALLASKTTSALLFSGEQPSGGDDARADGDVLAKRLPRDLNSLL